MIPEIEHYIQKFPEIAQEKLRQIHESIALVAEGCLETINYQMPTFQLNGKNLVHYAGYKKHIGFYPAPSGIKAFVSELEPFKWSKGAVQFPLDQPLPLELIKKIVAFRLEEEKGRG